MTLITSPTFRNIARDIAKGLVHGVIVEVATHVGQALAERLFPEPLPPTPRRRTRRGSKSK